MFRQIYIAGESYAGQHIPYIADAILKRNKNESMVQDGHVWNVKGLLIGNGWIAPVEQYQAYLEFAYKEGIIQAGTEGAKQVEAQQSICLSKMGEPGGSDSISIPACENVLEQILDVTHQSEKCINMYDIRLRDTYPACGMNWPADLANVTPYLRRNEVTDALHINKDKKTGW